MASKSTKKPDDAGRVPYKRKELRAHAPERVFTGEHLAMVAFPLGGIGAGCVSLGGRGELRDWEIFNRPGKGKDLNVFFVLWAQAEGEEPVCQTVQRAPLPPYWGSGGWSRDGGKGLPPFKEAVFRGAYPFANIEFRDDRCPLRVSLEAFSPFIPLNEDDSGIPVAVLTYALHNPGTEPVKATLVGSFPNVIGTDGITFDGSMVGGAVNEFVSGDGFAGIKMTSPRVPYGDTRAGSMAITARGSSFTYLRSWEGQGWWDNYHRFWDDLEADGAFESTGSSEPSPEGRAEMASLGVRVEVAPGETVSVPFLITWHFPKRANSWDREPEVAGQLLTNHYATRFTDAWAVAEYVHRELPRLWAETRLFADALWTSTLPAQVLDAASSQASILVTQTCLRLDDGAFHGFEGCGGSCGCCPMNCTHVWNYEQTLAHLFPALERSVRRTDFLVNTRDDGHMAFRTKLPTGRVLWDSIGAADGQMGCIMKLYREWQLSGDDAFLTELWPRAKLALDYALSEWDQDGDGVMEGRQHNTYDIEFYGPNTMMGTLYLGALRAGSAMAEHLGDGDAKARWDSLFESGKAKLDEVCWNGEYYEQIVNLEEQPRYQYGKGCLADQLLGQWFAMVVGLGHVLPPKRVRRTLQSLFKHNFHTEFHSHPNPQRIYAIADEAGLLLCTWPYGGRPALPVVYCDEVWTGIEYQVAAHMIYEGLVDEGLSIVKGIRDRHDGKRRNPYNEFECGDHYARAMSSWSVLLALSGYSYSAPTGSLSFAPRTDRPKFQCFFSTGSGWGVFTARHTDGVLRLSLEVLYGEVTLRELGCAPLDRDPAKKPRRAKVKTGPAVEVRDGRWFAVFPEPVTLKAGEEMAVVLR